MFWSGVALWLLHDADAAVELTLGIVVVDVGIAATHVGGRHRGQAARIVRATVLKQYVGALLASGSSCVGQRCLAASISTFYINTILWERMTDIKIHTRYYLLLIINSMLSNVNQHTRNVLTDCGH